MSKDFLSHFLTTVANDLQLPQDAVFNLMKEDDWSFIVKLSSILEKFLGYLITSKVSDASLKGLIYEQSLEKKISLSQKMELITEEAHKEFNFVRRMRNRAAHGILFSFEEQFKDLDTLNDYKSLFKKTWNEKMQIAGKKVNGLDFAVENPKITLFMACAGHLSFADLEREMGELKSKVENMESLLGSILIS